MEPLSSAVLAGLVKGVVTALGQYAAGPTLGRLLERPAFQRALNKAWEATQRAQAKILADYDLPSRFLSLEAAPELAKALVPGLDASPDILADICVNSLGPGLSIEDRQRHRVRVRPVFVTLLERLDEALRNERSLRSLTTMKAAGRTAAGVDALAKQAQAITAPTGERDYLSWVMRRHLTVSTAGLVRNQLVELPLAEVFVGIDAVAEDNPGDRSGKWLADERERLTKLRQSGDLDPVTFEAELDRLRLRQPPGGEAPPGDRPALDFIRSKAHLLVLGEPGSGKTTILRYLALRHTRAALLDGPAPKLGPTRLPIYVRLREFAASPHFDGGLLDFLPTYLRGQQCTVDGLGSLLGRALAEGRCLVLLDGLDEVSTAEDRQRVVTAVTNFVDAHSLAGNTFVVTSRVAGYQAAPLPPLFAAIRLREMNDATIEQFTRVYTRAVARIASPDSPVASIEQEAAEAAATLVSALRGNPGVRRLAVNPLLLTALILVQQSQGRQLPHRRADAYVEVTNALSWSWRITQGVSGRELPEEEWVLTDWLTHLGSWLHENRPEGAGGWRDLLEVLGPLWSERHGLTWNPGLLDAADPLVSDVGQGVKRFVRATEEQTGLLVERAPERYGFPHQTFEEFYAGRALVTHGPSAGRPAAIRRHLHDSYWREPILLGLGLLGGRTAELEEIVAQAIYPGPGDPDRAEQLLGRDFLFALRVLADDIHLTTTTVDALLTRATDEFLGTAGQSRFTAYHRRMAEHLAGLGGTFAGQRVLTIVGRTDLANVEPTLVLSLASALGWADSLPTTVIDALITVTTNPDNAFHLRIGAARALRQGDALLPLAIDTLTAIATSPDNNHDLRIQAAQALRQSDTLLPLAIDTLTAIAADPDNDLSLRQRAIAALPQGDALTPKAIDALITIATNSANKPYLRVEAAQALRQGDGLLPKAIDTLTVIATNPNNDLFLRIQAAESLRQSDALLLTAIETLIAIANNPGNNPNLRSWALDALGLSDGLPASAIDTIAAIATDSGNDPGLRIQAAWTLRQADALPPIAIDTLTDIAANPDINPYSRVRAALSLRLGDTLLPTAIETLTAIATNPDDDAAPGPRLEALNALATQGQSPTLSTVIVENVKRWALPLPPDIAGHDDFLTRRDAIACLRFAPSTDDLLDYLVSRLRDPDNDVRKAVSRVLVAHAHRAPGVRDRLVAAIDSPEFEIEDEYEKRPAADYAYDALAELE